MKMLNFESLDIQVWCRKDNFKHKKHSHTINIVFQVYLQVFFKFFFLSVLVIFNLTKEKVIFVSWKVVPANNLIKSNVYILQTNYIKTSTNPEVKH